MADVTVPFTGWGRAGFGDLAWGEGSVAVGFATGAKLARSRLSRVQALLLT
jgi:hypothetical protein